MKNLKFRIIALMMIGLLLNLTFYSTTMANTKEEKLEAKVRVGIAKLGIGKESKVKVKLKDNTEIKGYISEITEEGFSVVDGNLNVTKNVLYPQVKQIKGNNLSKGVRIAIAIGVILAIGIVFALLHPGD